ncbi:MULTISPECIES: hypothetical protein [unclassified Archaeoglobus]|jgi:hypothetical protein|uniref:hypothetical protein n=1 Tax=unclassified Archaeoglobus TaxID=2643606 RepID=UPI0025BA307D|nr:MULTISPECIES: hypothetical protein [unclassified Archaeoglobus]
MRRTVLVFLLLATGGVAVAMASNDEVSILFNSWLGGKPLGLVKMKIKIPEVKNARSCFVAVHRFPTPSNPTEKGLSEVVYRGKVPCNSEIEVKDLINMIEVKTIEINGEIKAVFDSPEYFVVVMSDNGYSFGRIIQTRIERPITAVEVKAKLEKPEENSAKLNSVKVNSKKSEECDVHIEHESGSYGYDVFAAGSCIAKTRLTYINSIPGLKVAFGLKGGTPASAMYLESWGSSCISSDPFNPCPSYRWSSDGKKRATSLSSEVTSYIYNGQRAVVWGSVKYVYERHAYWDDDFNIYWKYDIFYPSRIRYLIPPEVVGSYQQPSSPPWYAGDPTKGDRDIWFDDEPYLSNHKLSISTYIGLNIGAFSMGISISPYKAGEDNELYTTPYIRIKDVSGKGYAWYYLWYKNNDPMTYEVQFYGS